MKSFKENGLSYHWVKSKGETVSELLGFDIKELDDDGFQFYKSGLIQKILEDTVMDNYNGLKTPIKVDEPLGIYKNGPGD